MISFIFLVIKALLVIVGLSLVLHYLLEALDQR